MHAVHAVGVDGHPRIKGDAGPLEVDLPLLLPISSGMSVLTVQEGLCLCIA